MLIADPPPPDLPVSERYGAAPEKPRGAPPALDWWTTFSSAELSGLVERALAVNHDIGAAIARIEQADAQIRVSGALLLPTGGVGARRILSRDSAAAIDLDDKLPNQRVTRVGLQASYELDFWGKNAALVRAAERTALASRFNRDVVELTVVSTLVNTYLEILSLQDRLRIAQSNLGVATRVRSIIQQRLEAGTSTTIDLSQQDYIVVQQQAVIPRLVRALRQDKAAIATLTGDMPAAITIRGGSLARVRLPAIAPGVPSDLLLNRPDIREAEERLAAASANVASARVALLPTIQVTAEGGWASTIMKTLITPQAALYNVTTSITQPIFDAPRLIGQIDLQLATQRELLERYRQSIIAGVTDVERALIALREIAREEALARQAVAVSQRGYELSESQLRGGSIDLTTMLNIQRTLFEAQDALVQIKLLRFQAAVALYQALGGGWKFERDATPQPDPLPDVPPN